MVFRKRAGMILSVSTLASGNGAAMAVRLVNFSIPLPSAELAHVGQPSRHCRGSSHGGRKKVCSPSRALPALEIAVRGASAPLSGLELVGIHAKAHRAARL